MSTPQVAEYFRLWQTCAPKAARLAEIDRAIAGMLRGEERYEYVCQRTPKRLPWVVVALLHYREASLSFEKHLHNGDPLSARTVNVPAGRPLSKGPWSWATSALDALAVDRLDKVVAWDISQICLNLERFNGGGYRKRGLRSPYLWGGSNHQQPGKYVADGKFDPEVMDAQLGCITILRRMAQRDLLSLRAIPTGGRLA